MSDLEWMRQKDAERRARDLERLRLAREEAARAGKELFDFARLLELYDPSSELSASTRLEDPAEVAASLEKRYYLDYPGVLTLEDFARKLSEYRPFT